MKIIGFNGSPRKDGNTVWVLNKILEGAKEQGAEIQLFNELDIKPCKGCLGCVKSGKCGINDDMQKIYNALEQADVLVLGTPVYMGQMTAQAKAFTDRLFAQITPRFSPRFQEKNAGKKLILIFTQGNPDQDKFKTYFEYTKDMFTMLEFDVKGLYVIAGLRTESASDRKDLHTSMKEIGSLLATP